MEEIPTDTVKVFEGILPELDFSKAEGDEFMVFSSDEGKLTIFDPKKHPQSSKPIVLTTQLNAKETLLGSLALVTALETVQDLTGEKSPMPWLTTTISSLLYNAISQEQNAEKIRFLRLYQTVSSALAMWAICRNF